MANLLIKRVEEGQVVKIKGPKPLWNKDKFLKDAKTRCYPDRVEVMEQLINFTTSKSDAGILWGSGSKYGSFSFKKIINNNSVSLFQVYTDGSLFLYFKPLINRGVDIGILKQFQSRLNSIPEVSINDKVIEERTSYGSLGLSRLINPKNMEIFQDAILFLCINIDASIITL